MPITCSTPATQAAKAAQRPIFVVTLQAAPGSDAIRSLRALLKYAWRRLGLRALEVREINDPDNSDNIAKWRRKALTEIMRVVFAANDVHSTQAASQEVIDQ